MPGRFTAELFFVASSGENASGEKGTIQLLWCDIDSMPLRRAPFPLSRNGCRTNSGDDGRGAAKGR